MDEQLVEVKFLDWMTHPPEDDPVLLLHAEEVNRIVPIWIDVTSATQYSARETGTTQRRPGMHEVFADTLDLVGQSALRGQITGVHEGGFIASLVLEGGTEIDMRPSDLVLIAAELEVPLYIARDVLDMSSVPARLVATNGGSLADDAESDSVEASVSEFAQFLDSIDADYFAESHGAPEDDFGDDSSGGPSGDSDGKSDRDD
ncbi:MAG: bifunctional nuclease family protein [Corynebacterium sp.]|uniref:bifunctional nuclease family protein n=1 Tax=Corynebacterium sp. TaxID=1720 RepID=UPI0026DBA698|nr:bifunctional nuclease family protein [Corynebacterium sp.]MDO5028999.1 bifunctional nuclease family protein [Corynebacterium sp.]